MRYLPHGPADRKAMLQYIGASGPDDLVATVPEELRLRGPLDLPPPLSEMELQDRMSELSMKNASTGCYRSFLGAGAYDHFVPVAVDHLLSRTEFYSSYTPYQPEISQGTLQTIFEFQSLVCMLTELDVANASLYDGATAVVEALLMASRVVGRDRIVVAGTLHPEYLATVRTYFRNLGLSLTAVPWGDDGRVDPRALGAAVDESTAAVAVQSPNAFGVVERLDRISAEARAKGAAAVAVVAEPYSLGVLRGPGALGCDVAVGEAQAFGNALSFGGPYLGFMAARDRYVRQMPGRIVGETTDLEGRRGFVLTLSTREQHIRRAKATSNICTNQGLCMTAATIHLALIGREGLRGIALANRAKASYTAGKLAAVKGVKRAFAGPVFNEFVLDLPRPAAEVLEALRGKGILGGLDLSRWFPEMRQRILVAVTERTRREDSDAYAAAMAEVL
ncbi:MAG: aminomethyl-transferring glycine dehydrogenase subunit GcvPA [Acidobacteriia bacterium]|nr:aminomethyl-transferring glycine dehydrogenase subunit GcvPA [Terriglobia bacterium]